MSKALKAEAKVLGDLHANFGGPDRELLHRVPPGELQSIRPETLALLEADDWDGFIAKLYEASSKVDLSKESEFAQRIREQKYSHTKADGTKETWEEIARRVTDNVMDVVDISDSLKEEIYEAIASKKFIPGGRYLYASGRDFHQTQNCLLLRAEDSREGWSELLYKTSMALMTGAGIGVDYSCIRPKGAKITRTGGECSGPISLMEMVNEAGRHIMQGGSRRSAIWAGLTWAHPDVMEFVNKKNWSPAVKAMKEQDYFSPAPLDNTNISVLLDDEFFEDYKAGSKYAHDIYKHVVRQMCETAEPGFSVDVGENAGETLRNACTEVTSRDDSDICNLGSVNMARISSLEEMESIVYLGTIFLLAGTIYSHVPYQKVDEVREYNRRLGLGLMGVHEFQLKHGGRYEMDDNLRQYLAVYRDVSRETADYFADLWDISQPVKVRAIAPTGTIGIVAETTTGIEPIFCVAYKRRYIKNDQVAYEYVIDPTAKRLIDSGVDPDSIEDSYTLAQDVERRLAFQADVQEYVDHGISSTINLPAWGTEFNNEQTVDKFAKMLINYLPRLRGVTCYPDGCRGGQPLTRCDYKEASGRVGNVFYEGVDICDITKKGSCG